MIVTGFGALLFAAERTRKAYAGAGSEPHEYKEVSMHIIIIGCGRVGARLASLLSSSGHTVVVIDKIRRLLNVWNHPSKGKTIEGVGFDRKTLLDAVSNGPMRWQLSPTA